MAAGHYYAVIKSPSNQWYRCDDIVVTPITRFTAGMVEDVYIAFYQRKAAGNSNQTVYYNF